MARRLEKEETAAAAAALISPAAAAARKSPAKKRPADRKPPVFPSRRKRRARYEPECDGRDGGCSGCSECEDEYGVSRYHSDESEEEHEMEDRDYYDDDDGSAECEDGSFSDADIALIDDWDGHYDEHGEYCAADPRSRMSAKEARAYSFPRRHSAAAARSSSPPVEESARDVEMRVEDDIAKRLEGYAKSKAKSKAAAAAAAVVPLPAAGARGGKRVKKSTGPADHGCPLCSKLFSRSDIGPHASSCRGPDQACPLGCGRKFSPEDMEEHAPICEGPDQPCKSCDKLFIPSTLPAHGRECLGRPMLCPLCEQSFGAKVVSEHMSRCVGKDGRECVVCSCLLPPSEIDVHQIACARREAEMSQDEKMAIGVGRKEQESTQCNATQLQAIEYVADKAKKLSQKAEPALLKRFESMGFSLRELKQCLKYIRNLAPLIIHVNLTNCMGFFVRDTHVS